MIEKIQVQAEQIFKLFGMRDFARFDGWILNDGTIWFSDLNPISGMEQNSFLFQQASRVGMSHRDLLRFVVRRASERYGIFFPDTEVEALKTKKPVTVLFGGSTSERQVSLMSGTNVWLKLRKSSAYDPTPYLLEGEDTVWKLPYAYTLNHTVEEIIANCKAAKKDEERIGYLEQKVRLRLAFREGESSEPMALPLKMSLSAFLEESKFVFIALHGGMGEDGRLQKLLRRKKVRFNGPDENVSRLCMDKYLTGRFLAQAEVEGTSSIPSLTLPLVQIKNANAEILWKKLRTKLEAKTIVVKPRADGCSSGVVHLYTASDLEKYRTLVERKAFSIPAGTFTNQREIIEMPMEFLSELLFEKFIETDVVRVKGNTLKYARKSGWVEVTVGVVGMKNGLKVLNPSMTVAEGEVLSVEEKFQGGTGINITPPPQQVISKKILEKVKGHIREVAEKIGITGYSRIDAFVQVATGNVSIIEVNTLPGLTPSTVLYHQALAEHPSIYPTELLEIFIKNKGY
jgi:D-alanine-D-alanine ligase-like ATP-grasp enzyme